MRRVRISIALMLGLLLVQAGSSMIARAVARPVIEFEDGDSVSIATARRIHSAALGEDRVLLVSLPDDYESARFAYPVLYVLYGDQVRGYLAETVHVVDRLSKAGVIPRLIVVGIANVERYRDLSPVGRRGHPSGIGRFIEFVRDEMLPFIEAEYRTKSYRILIGPQAGAEFGMHVLAEGLGLFDAYILNNPFEGAYAAELSERADEFLGQGLPSYTFLQITCIDRHLHGELTEAVSAARRFEQAALDGNAGNLDLNMIYVENNEDFIPSPRPKDGLKKLFADYAFPEERSVEKLSDFISYYDRLSARLGFDVGFPEQTLYLRADGLARAGKAESAIEMLNYIIEWNPRSLNAYWCLANTYRELGDRAKAMESYRKCLEIMPNMAPAREWLQKLSAE